MPVHEAILAVLLQGSGAVLVGGLLSPLITGQTAVERVPVPLVAVSAKQSTAEHSCAVLPPWHQVGSCSIKFHLYLLENAMEKSVWLASESYGHSHLSLEILRLKPPTFTFSCVCSYLELTQCFK